MFKSLGVKIPTEHRNAFFKTICMESIMRIRTVLALLLFLQFIQLLIYIFTTDNSLKVTELIFLKLFIILFSFLSYIILSALIKRNTFLNKYEEIILNSIVFIILCWSVINTFIAQSITSDISIYVLALFAISAIVRMRQWITISIYGFNYLFFLIGISYYQQNQNYRTSHIMNGLILNIIAYLTAHIIYKYSLSEYLDKHKINLKNSELLHLARHDGLTSLYNHQAIHELLEQAIKRAKEFNENLSIMLIDLDYFKELNDILGHKAGDSVLRKISDCIKHNIRQKDMAGRYGGDEFLVILPDSDINQAKEIAVRLLNEIRHQEFKGMKLSFSCGIAGWGGHTVEQLIDEADKILYRVKNDGRNNIYVLGG